jgi:hypothetical protein
MTPATCLQTMASTTLSCGRGNPDNLTARIGDFVDLMLCSRKWCGTGTQRKQQRWEGEQTSSCEPISLVQDYTR